MQKIRAVKASNVNQIVIPSDLAGNLLSWFVEGRDLSARDQRDFPRLIDLVKAHALFQMFNREITESPDGCSVRASAEDVEVAKQLLYKVLDANRMGLPPYVHKFYFEMLEPFIKEDGISREEFSRLYFKHFNARIGEKARKQLIELLCDAGLIEEKTDPEDKRRMKIYVPLGEVEKEQKKCGDTVTEATEVTVSMHSAERNPLLAFFENPNTLHGKTVTPVTSVTKPLLQGIAVVSHVKTSEQCYNGCPYLAEWAIRIEPDFEQQFCNDCFNKAKQDLESNGYTVKFAEAQQR